MSWQRSNEAIPARRASFLAVSTEDARLTLPVRLLSAVLGLILMALGFGILFLLGMGIRESTRNWGFVALFPMRCVFAGYGIDLLGRAILGRPWSRRLWNAMERWLTGHRSSRWWGWIALVALGGRGTPRRATSGFSP